MAFTYSDAEKVVNDYSYKSLPTKDLEEMRNACRNVSGINQINIDRIRRAGDIIGEELSSREADRQRQAASNILASGADEPPELIGKVQSSESSIPWDEECLTKMIQDNIEESLGIEYKAAAALGRDDRTKSEITKDVSAMANSAGGVIIYGISEFQDEARKHRPERLDPIRRTEYSREWLEQIINQIRPRIPDLLIYPVSLGSDLDKIAYVVEVPSGTTAHQARDHRYYRRYNFESLPMHDHEIRDVMNRHSHPRVTVSARFVLYPRTHRNDKHGALIMSIKNKSDLLARYVGIVVNAPLKFRDNIVGYDGAVLEEGDDGSSFRLSFSNHNSAPLFPQANLEAMFKFEFGLRLQPEPLRQITDFRYAVYADSMPKQEGSFTYDQIFFVSGQQS